ncbi:CarD family transcriptional regulator [Clostridium thailandense]|uniref:Transcriptional regulator n=1 Tax=Clostridium thailandense TaxID=2794346 RepID=A0A949TZ58_9CLOT|nr:CarD family transcriptional regulator [Clostridium thailandense]MBV7274486.1 transcriptional regulator [Clostridium thailandense]
MLNYGLKVFVPNYGAGIMTTLEDNKDYDIDKKYISISFLLNDIDLYIPEDKVSCYRIRNVVNQKEMDYAMNIVRDEPIDIEKKWGKRYRMNNDKIKTGNLYKMCEVVRDLYYLKHQGMLPPGEKKILSNAENMIASELALVLDINLEEAVYKIRNLG